MKGFTVHHQNQKVQHGFLVFSAWCVQDVCVPRNSNSSPPFSSSSAFPFPSAFYILSFSLHLLHPLSFLILPLPTFPLSTFNVPPPFPFLPVLSLPFPLHLLNPSALLILHLFSFPSILPFSSSSTFLP